MAEFIGPAVVFAFSLKYGVGGKSLFDRVCLAMAVVAFALLLAAESPVFGLILALFVDSIGSLLTLRKLLKDRSSEPKLPWGLGAVAAILSVFALETFSIENLLFPIYVTIVSIAVFVLAKPSKPTKAKLRELNKL